MSNENKFEPGEVVTIYNQTLSGEVIVEGKAKLVRALLGTGTGQRRWSVVFENECHELERVIHTSEEVEDWKKALASF